MADDDDLLFPKERKFVRPLDHPILDGASHEWGMGDASSLVSSDISDSNKKMATVIIQPLRKLDRKLNILKLREIRNIANEHRSIGAIKNREDLFTMEQWNDIKMEF